MEGYNDAPAPRGNVVGVTDELSRVEGPEANSELSEQEQELMMKSIEEIFELRGGATGGDVEIEDEEGVEEVGGDAVGDGDGDGEEVVDFADRERRTERLRGVLGVLAKLWWAGSENMDVAAEKLADGSRDPKWRIPLGDSGVLEFFLGILSSHELRYTLKVHALRCIGNSCADTDENRARVVASNHLPSIITQLKDTSLLAFVIPVLFNICMDYEPAQLQASKCYLSKELIELISSSRFNDSRAFLGYVCKILDLLIAQPTEPELAPDNTAIVLLNIAADRRSPSGPVDMEDFISLVNTAVLYLTHERYQKALINQGALDTALAVLVDSYTRFDSHPSISPSAADEDDAKILSQMRSNLNQVLSDVSALPEFKAAVPVTSPYSASLRRWLSSPQLQLQVCACIMLGNLARSDEACIEFVHVSKVHIPLISVLTTATDSQLLHAALGFLKNLALPLKNKEIIGATGPGDAGIFEVLPRLWQLDTLQQIQFSSVSLARQLMVGTYENLRKITRRLSADPSSPANNRSKLSLLITLFDRTDVEPIKMEIARLITAICRTFYSYVGEDWSRTVDIRTRFLEVHPDFCRPLSFMVSQTKWPVVRSEGWFVFALMARTPEGAQHISDMMQDMAVFQPLVHLLTGKDLVDYKPSSLSPEASVSTSLSPSSSTTLESTNPLTPASPEQPHVDMTKIDRENALVMVSELLKNRGEEMAVMRRTLFEDLLKGGGEVVMSYSERKEKEKEVAEREGPNPRPRKGKFEIGEIAEQTHFALS